MAIPWEGLGLLLAAFVAGLAKSGYNGLLRDAINNKRSAKDAHDLIPELKARVDQIHDDMATEEQVEHVDEKTEDLRIAFTHVHSDDLRDDPLLRNRLDVSNDDDLLGDD